MGLGIWGGSSASWIICKNWESRPSGSLLSTSPPWMTMVMIFPIMKPLQRFLGIWPIWKNSWMRLRRGVSVSSWTWWSTIPPMNMPGLSRPVKIQTVPSGITISGAMSPMLWFLLFPAQPGNMMRPLVSIISTSLVKSSQIWTGKTKNCVRRFTTWWIAGLTREWLVFGWMSLTWLGKSLTRKSQEMAPSSMTTSRKCIRPASWTRTCWQWAKPGEPPLKLPSSIPIQTTKNCPWSSSLNISASCSSRIRQSGIMPRSWMCQPWRGFSPSGKQS